MSALVSDAELTAMYGRGLRPETAMRVIDEVRRLRRELNDERVRNQHDRDLARELGRALVEAEDRSGAEWIGLQTEVACLEAAIERIEAKLAEAVAALRRASVLEIDFGLRDGILGVLAGGAS